MDNTTLPQQLSLSFDVPAEVTTIQSHRVVAEKSVANVAVVYDFKSASAKLEASNKAALYRQILASVRHIG